MTRIKICGVTRADDAARVAAAGVDYLGLNFWPRSKRYLDPARAPLVAAAARAAGAVALVGVFVDASLDELRAVAPLLDVLQLHGEEDPARVAEVAAAIGRPVWKAVRVAAARDVDHLGAWAAEAMLLDAPSPGAGVAFDHAHARRARELHPALRVVLAGGLAPETVAAAIAAVDPWCVDVATGVQAAPGVVDPEKLAAFVAAVRAAARPPQSR